ncbi:hypothetical protein AJ88_02565 [Mesorhizobium amorphae CCBAU 01583]|nr:hypothetical protein AJ88_02565 [Mesorhizobium amorphae CCBAU 01583]
MVKRLTEEFFAGLGQRETVQRTVFAVGDEKQSIYPSRAPPRTPLPTAGFCLPDACATRTLRLPISS